MCGIRLSLGWIYGGRHGAQWEGRLEWTPADLRSLFSLLTTQPCICKVGTLRKCPSKVRKRKTNIVYEHIYVESRKTV